MAKKITFSGIEILTPQDDLSAKSLLDYVESVINHLEQDLGKVSGNFHLSINMDFSSNKKTAHKVFASGSESQKTVEKVSKLLDSTGIKDGISATIKVDMEVEDR